MSEINEWCPEEKSWDEFRTSGLLWWVNRILHFWGWAIVCEMKRDSDDVERVYPARVSYRGFDDAVETDGFRKLTKHTEDNVEKIKRDVES